MDWSKDCVVYYLAFLEEKKQSLVCKRKGSRRTSLLVEGNRLHDSRPPGPGIVVAVVLLVLLI
jgi:hypothetical protein